MRTLLTIGILLLTQMSFAQSGIISITDADTGAAIPNATVVFENLTSKKLQQVVISDDNGEVLNTVTKKSKITISHVGFRTIKDSIDPNISKTYKLKEDVFLLDQIVVTGTRTKKTLKSAPILTHVITTKQIEAQDIQNVTEILSTEVPNIEFQEVGFGTNINLQGLTSKNILILIDGERLAGESSSNIDYSRLNTHDIERVEIVKGATSALYGSQAMGAVVNIITKSSKKKFYAIAASQYTTNYDTNYPNLKPDAAYYNPKKNLDKINLTQNYTIGFKLKKWSSKTSFVAKSKDAYELHDTQGFAYYFPEQDSTIYDEKYTTPMVGLKDFTVSQSVNYEISDKITIKTKASYYQHEQFDFLLSDNIHDLYTDFTYDIKTTYTPNTKTNYILSWHDDVYKKYDYKEASKLVKRNYTHHYTNPKITGNHQINNKQLLTVGVEYLKEALETDMFRYHSDDLITKTTSNTVLFVQDDYKISDKVNLIGGLRTEYHSAYGLHFTPKLAVMYKVFPYTVRANYASGYRSPNLKELYMNWDLLGMFTIIGNKDLTPETNHYFATSFEYSHAKFNTSASVYYNLFDNKIEGIWGENQETYNYINTKGNTSLYGLDYLLKYQPYKGWLAKLAYSYVIEYRDSGVRLSTISPHTGSLQVSYNLKRKKYDLNASITGKYIGRKDFEGMATITHEGEEIEAIYQGHYNAYSIWKMSLQQKYNQYLSLTLGINNLFNYAPKTYTFNTSHAPTRNYSVGVKLNLDQLYNNQFKTNKK